MTGSAGGGLFLAGLAGSMAALCCSHLVRAVRLRLRGARAAGTVIALDRTGGGRETAYHPVVQYRTAEGRLVQKVSPLGGGPTRPYRIGLPVTVLYDPARPDRMWISGKLLFGPIAALVMCLPFFGYGCWTLWSAVAS